MELTLGSYNIIIHIQPLQILEKYSQADKKSPESGGIILGKIFDSYISILKLSIPTPLDRASRTNFERHKLSAQIIIEYEHINSNGQLIYLGEWHTHPELRPSPSSQDIAMINYQFKTNYISTDFLVLMIMGMEGLYIRLVKNTSYYELFTGIS